MTDPICGMNVEPERAAGSHVYKGQTYYFCSQHCQAKFKEDPDKFLKPTPRGHPGHAHPHDHEPAGPQTHKTDRAEHVAYVCPMDPEVRESQPGACPKCGMALEPADIAPPATRIEYVCPMHPEIVRAEPASARSVGWLWNRGQ